MLHLLSRSATTNHLATRRKSSIQKPRVSPVTFIPVILVVARTIARPRSLASGRTDRLFDKIVVRSHLSKSPVHAWISTFRNANHLIPTVLTCALCHCPIAAFLPKSTDNAITNSCAAYRFLIPKQSDPSDLLHIVRGESKLC
ncbi:hypothetical protein PTTG_12199 [Puccinia triticina 1-1 BBBD Race 1]|uniref:Uncharacterized protein n=1 Tax=Puccinia triticina (isolate 1-1 / race 1 (BBBD)) TaxID=630390 RepID=A0A180GU54_PUCT1|nr:hypothetical protein PTTG_12199 [Puccinia triticina 1-1 BBBD Race 1]